MSRPPNGFELVLAAIFVFAFVATLQLFAK